MLGIEPRVSVCKAIISICGTRFLPQEPQPLVNNEGKEGEQVPPVESQADVSWKAVVLLGTVEGQ